MSQNPLNMSKIETQKFKAQTVKPDTSTPAVNHLDGWFCDSYGNRVKHGTKIFIESHCNFQHILNRLAVVEWHNERGMYRFRVIDGEPGGSISDFHGVHKFRVITPTKIEHDLKTVMVAKLTELLNDARLKMASPGFDDSSEPMRLSIISIQTQINLLEELLGVPLSSFLIR